jgi:hypothetical protein
MLSTIPCFPYNIKIITTVFADIYLLQRINAFSDLMPYGFKVSTPREPTNRL